MSDPITVEDLLRDPEPALLPVYVHDVAVLSALGNDLTTLLARLADPTPFPDTAEERADGTEVPLGTFPLDPEVEAKNDFDTFAHDWSEEDRLIASTRSWRSAYGMLKPLAAQLTKKEKLEAGLVFGCSTSGVAETIDRLGEFDPWPAVATLDPGRPARLLADALGLSGPAYVVSTACTSGAKAIAEAARLLQIGRTTVMLAGGLDTLNPLTQEGFSALGARSQKRARPFEAAREGLHLGEGGAFFLLSSDPKRRVAGSADNAKPLETWASVRLSSWGETSDAHHISAPHPEGDGAKRAMLRAMEMTEVTPDEVDYIHLHGTATRQNDPAEAKAVRDAGLQSAPASSIKRAVGHTLAGAGALGAAVAFGLLRDPAMPLPLAFRGDEVPDPEIPQLNWVREPVAHARRNVLVSAFAFGGSNASLLFSHTFLTAPCDARGLLPQTGPMRLVDEGLSYSEAGAESLMTVESDNLLLDLDTGRFPASGLMEVMAQTIGIFAGINARRAGFEPKIGLLLGSRKITLQAPDYPVGTKFKTTAEKSFVSDEGLWQFACRSEALLPGETEYRPAADAVLTVFDAPDGYFNDFRR